jgi:hypothetical protein
MRIFTAFAIAAALALGTPAFVQAQAQGTSPQSEAKTPAAQSNKVIQSVRVVDVKDLKPEMRSKVDDVVAHTSEEDMQSLRKSIDATPEAASALKAEGLTSAQVVAINITGGVLTMFAKTAWNKTAWSKQLYNSCVQQEKPVARSGGLSSFGMIGIFQSRFTSLMMNDPQPPSHGCGAFLDFALSSRSQPMISNRRLDRFW